MSMEKQGYDSMCDRIKQLENVRFAGVINERGKLIAGGIKNGLVPLSSQKEDEMLFMELAIRVRMRKEFNEQLGPVTFAMAARQKSLEMSFPLNGVVLYVVAESSADFCELPKKILKIISEP
jgi:hypothetical protein